MRRLRSCRLAGFTIVELMVAIFIFTMVLAAIYSTWLLILRSRKLGKETAAEVQRSRIAIETVRKALLTAQFFVWNKDHYLFYANTEGDTATLSLVSRLPEDFPGVGKYQSQFVRRVNFEVKPGPNGNELVMTQAPMLVDTKSSFEAYSMVLARDVKVFTLEFWHPQTEWQEAWDYTNALPALVRVTLGLGSKGEGNRPHNVMATEIAVPAAAVTPNLAVLGDPINPGGVPNPLNPNQPGVPGQPGLPGQQGQQNFRRPGLPTPIRPGGRR